MVLAKSNIMHYLIAKVIRVSGKCIHSLSSAYAFAGLFRRVRETFMGSELHCMFSAAVEMHRATVIFMGGRNCLE